MKEIVLPVHATGTIALNKVKQQLRFNNDAYVCYIVASNAQYQSNEREPGTDVAFLIPLANGAFGFVYHKDLLKGYPLCGTVKFARNTATESMHQVLEAGKKLLMLESYEEVLELCSKYKKH